MQCIENKVSFRIASYGPVNANDPACSQYYIDAGLTGTPNWAFVGAFTQTWFSIVAKYFFDNDPSSAQMNCPNNNLAYNFFASVCVKWYIYPFSVTLPSGAGVTLQLLGLQDCGDLCCEVEIKVCKDASGTTISTATLIAQNFQDCAQQYVEVPEDATWSSLQCQPFCFVVP